jgi:hypothetical protein
MPMSGNHRNDLQQKGFKTSSQAAFDKLQQRYLKGVPSRQEMLEHVARLESLIGLVYRHFPDLQASLDKAISEAKAKQPMVQTPVPADEMLVPVNASTESAQ